MKTSWWGINILHAPLILLSWFMYTCARTHTHAHLGSNSYIFPHPIFLSNLICKYGGNNNSIGSNGKKKVNIGKGSPPSFSLKQFRQTNEKEGIREKKDWWRILIEFTLLLELTIILSGKLHLGCRNGGFSVGKARCKYWDEPLIPFLPHISKSLIAHSSPNSLKKMGGNGFAALD